MTSRRAAPVRRLVGVALSMALVVLVVACYPVITQWIMPTSVAAGVPFWSTLVVEMGGDPWPQIPTWISLVYDIPLTWVIDYGHLTAYIGGEVYEWDDDSIEFMDNIWCSGTNYYPAAGHQFIKVTFVGDLAEPLDQGDYGVFDTRMTTQPGETGIAEVGVTIWSYRDGGGVECDPFSYRLVSVTGDPLFSDGFESGDTSAWSAVVP